MTMPPSTSVRSASLIESFMSVPLADGGVGASIVSRGWIGAHLWARTPPAACHEAIVVAAERVACAMQ